MKLKNFFEGGGIAVALTLPYLWQPLTPTRINGLYLRALPVNTIAGAVAVDLVAVTLLSWAVLEILDRHDRNGASLFWLALIAAVPSVLLRTVLLLTEMNFHMPNELMLFGILSAPFLLFWKRRIALYRCAVRLFRGFYFCMGLCLLWILPQLLFLSSQIKQRDAMQFERPVAQTNTNQTRIVWLLLDELSYDQLFDHRQPDLSLPAFDALRAESFSFSHIRPAGFFTDEIIPALLSGKPVNDIHSSLDGWLYTRTDAQAHWQRFDPEQTLFADAQKLGWSTRVVGWYNPYCRLFTTTIDRCQWMPESVLFPGHMSTENSIGSNALAPLGNKFGKAGNKTLPEEHIAAYRQLSAAAQQAAADPQARFVFLHLPVPHPPGIYSRRNHRLQPGGSYIDNLALADLTLQSIRASIAASPSAGKTILIVSSDHSYRVPLWRNNQYWTREDETVFHDHFDQRPTLFVHFPDQHKAIEDRAVFHELETHTMIEQMLHGQIATARAFDTWRRALSH